MSSLAFLFGGLVTLFGIDLHNTYDYQETYETALHWHLGAGWVIFTGIMLAVIGLIGIVMAIASRQD